MRSAIRGAVATVATRPGIMRGGRVVRPLTLALSTVAFAGCGMLGGLLPGGHDTWTPGGGWPGSFVSTQVSFDYSSDWHVVAMGPLLRNGPVQSVGILATAGVHFACPPYGCWPPTLDPDAVMLEFDNVGAIGDSLQPDGPVNTTLGGHPARLESHVDTLGWTILWPGGRYEFVVTATISGPDTAAMRQKVLAVLSTLRVEPPSVNVP